MFEELLEIYKTKAKEIEKNRKEAEAMLLLVSAIEKISRELLQAERCRALRQADRSG